MIEEILNEIKIAEEEAEKIKQEAKTQVESIIANAQKEAQDIKIQTEKNLKAYYQNSIMNANTQAQKNYNDRVSECKAQCKALNSQKTEIVDELAKQVFGRILDGDC